jgi:hypothetical protein
VERCSGLKAESKRVNLAAERKNKDKIQGFFAPLRMTT